jgi:hypothetical protein
MSESTWKRFAAVVVMITVMTVAVVKKSATKQTAPAAAQAATETAAQRLGGAETPWQEVFHCNFPK